MYNVPMGKNVRTKGRLTMKSLNVIVADADRDALIRNTRHLSEMDGIDVVASTMYGQEVIEKVYSSDVDILVTDIVLKGIDGIGVLDAFRTMSRPTPKKLILTRMNTAFVQDAVFERGASFFMTKPTTPAQLCERIRMLGGAEGKQRPHKENDVDVSALLRRIGVSPEMKGYRYLEEAVRMRVNGEGEARRLTEEIYPAIAVRFSTTAQSVERAIRTAIGSAWKNGAIQRYAIETSDEILLSRKPTAGEMIDRLYKNVSGRFLLIN